jgi:F0F1-type ATP synthase gamma subunit
MILITSQGSFSGDIDQKLIAQALSHYDPKKNDILVVGLHGVGQLKQRGVKAMLSFRMPTSDRHFNVTPLITMVQKYSSTLVYYTSYISIMQQDVKTIALGSAISQRGANVVSDDVIDERTYIFEPSTKAVIEHLESAMTGIALSEVIWESKLAQYASRFRSNKLAHEKAGDTVDDLNLQYSRAKRQMKDERLKEIMNGLRTEGDV